MRRYGCKNTERNCPYTNMQNNNDAYGNNLMNNMGCGCQNNWNNNSCGCGNMINNDDGCGCGLQNDPSNNYPNNCCANDNNNVNNRVTREQMRRELQEIDFTIQELALYLDTHPEDTRAICMHNEYAKKYRKLSDEYQKIYGPLTIMFPCNSWRWLEQPWPWERPNGMYNRESIEDDNRDFELKGGVE